jgi:ATP-binding cassette, subfamily B, bacterial
MTARLQKNPLIYLACQMWKYSQGNRKNVVLYLILFAGANATKLTSPLIFAMVFNAIQVQGVTSQSLPRILGLLSLIVVREMAFWVFHGPARILENENAFLLRMRYKQSLVDGVLSLPIEWHVNHHSGDTIDKIEKGSSRLFSYTEGSFLIIQMVLGLIGAVAAMMYFNIPSALIALGCIGVNIAIVTRFDRILVHQYQALSRAENRISEKVVDTITNITTVIILRIQKSLSTSIAANMAEPWPLYQKNIRINEIKWCLMNINTKLMVFLTIGYYLWHQYDNGLPILIGTVFALHGYTENISANFQNFAGLYSDILRQRASVANAEELSDDFPNATPLRTAAGMAAWSELSVKSLTFSYRSEEGADVHLDDINMSFRRGERVALIGETGSGKSTLLKVIRELYHPQHAAVFLDDRLLPNHFASISHEITLVPQEPEIFATTILENVTMGVDYNPPLIRHYTDMAKFTGVADALPRGFASSICEKGVNLSGGEKQRLALARGLLACHDKSIVLLDEPTSSIDITNEIAIYRNIFEAFKEKAIISSVHHLHLLPLFDRIYLFSDGRIVASGTLEQLLEHSGMFREMWDRYRSNVA